MASCEDPLHLPKQKVDTPHTLPRDVQSHHKVREVLHTCYNRKKWQEKLCVKTVFLLRLVEDELFPALRDLGMRFYAYNPVSSKFRIMYVANIECIEWMQPLEMARTQD